MARLHTEICGVSFPSILMNAAGAKDVSLDDLRALGQSKAGAIVVKTATKAFRAGNDLPRWYVDDLGSVNSMGLPNLGYEAYAKAMRELKAYKKPVIVSVSGLKQGDNEEMITAYDTAGVDMVEVNLSCPNLVGKGQLGYDFEASEKMLKSCRKQTKKPMGAKLPPYFDGFQYERMAKVLKRAKVDFIVTINSVGNTLIVDAERERKVIAPNNGLGGLGGAYVKPISLANVHTFYQLTEGQLPIIGVGGVQDGIDAFEHLLAGATAVGIGTALVNEGTDIFERVGKELADMMERKRYRNPSEVRGKLQDLPGTPADSGAASA